MRRENDPEATKETTDTCYYLKHKKQYLAQNTQNKRKAILGTVFVICQSIFFLNIQRALMNHQENMNNQVKKWAKDWIHSHSCKKFRYSETF